MYTISNEIYDSITNAVIVNELSNGTCKNILKTLTKLYVDAGKNGYWLWENLRDHIELSDSKGWSYIQNYVKSNSCILFFNQDEEKKMFKVSNGKDLQYILSETSGFEFYITDDDCSYLLCFNHHDVLIGCGKAMKWVEGLKNEDN